MKKLFLSVLYALSAMLSHAADPTLTPKDGYPDFALGADISWTPYIENNHLHTYYKGYKVASDQTTTIADMVSDHGIDAIRLRVWVDPKNPMAMSGFTFTADGYKYDEMSTFGTCSVDEMVALATRFAKTGQRLLVTFQLSDTWADPARQFIPESWAQCTSVQELSDKVCDHVKQVLTLLHNANVNVAWVQIGNETNTGMLKYKLPTSATGANKVSSVSFGCEISQKSANSPSETTKNFIKVFSDASKAAKEIYPKSKIILHLTKTSQWNTLNWTLNLLNRAGLSSEFCDYIGLSLYPGIDDGQENYTAKWKTYADLGIKTIKNIYSTYGFRTMLCEIGMNNEYSLSANTQGVAAANMQECYIKQCNTDVRAFTEYLIENLAKAESTCDGLFYWEPETDYMKEYTKGACVSITPGASWPRTKITANDWWKVIKENSSFPAGGLVDYVISDDTTPSNPPTPGFVPDPNLKLFLYYYDNNDNFVPLNTNDGLLYTLSDFQAQQWFKFKIVTDDWTIALGNAEIGLNTIGILNNRNDWFAWTATQTPASYKWWYRHDTNAMTITADDTCPWADIDAGISDVRTDYDSSEAQYYNMQGIKVTNPTGGIYIRRIGDKATKVAL